LGRTVYERQADPVTWAGRVLDAVAQGPYRTPEIEAALHLAGDRDQWHRGREVFDEVRAGPPFEGLGEEQRAVFGIAEIVAKVAHNAAGPAPYFDHHAGWRIAPLAHRVTAADPGLRARVDAVLGD
jgi:deoxyribonuclease V